MRAEVAKPKPIQNRNCTNLEAPIWNEYIPKTARRSRSAGPARGPPLILVDGALCYRASGPSGPLAALLTPHFTVITYDRRGRGDSGDTAPYAVEREVEDIAVFVREVAGGSAFVYGVSSGAAFALRRPAVASRQETGPLEAPFIVDDTRARFHRTPSPQLKELDRRGSAERGGQALHENSGRPGSLIALMRFMPAWSKLKGVGAYASVQPDDRFGQPARQTATIDTVDGCDVPTLTVAGGKSPLWMRNAMQALTRVLPSATHRTLEGQTHMVNAKALAPGSWRNSLAASVPAA